MLTSNTSPPSSALNPAILSHSSVHLVAGFAPHEQTAEPLLGPKGEFYSGFKRKAVFEPRSVSTAASRIA